MITKSKKREIINITTGSVILFAALISLANAELCPSGSKTCTFADLSENVIIIILEPIITVLFTLIGMMFIWGIVRYIGSANNTTEREKAKKFMVNSLIGIFVIISMWGIILVIKNGLGLDSTMPTL